LPKKFLGSAAPALTALIENVQCTIFSPIIFVKPAKSSAFFQRAFAKY